MYRVLLIVVLTFAFFKSKGQTNIIPNGSFETNTACPTGGAQWQRCANWNNVNMNPGSGPWGTPDYFTSCGTGGTAPPATFSGTCTAQSGNSMMGLVMYNVPFPDYREYLSTQLTCSMVPGVTYTLSFWLTNGTGIKSPYSIRNIGAHFSSSPLSQTGWGLVNVVPQCEITTNVVSTTWVQYTFTVNPTATWNYITLGCFRTDGNNNPTLSFPNPGGPASVYANYFIDNISVLAPSGSAGNISITANVTQPITCGGQGSATVTPSVSSPNITYMWTPGSYTSSNVSGLNPGSYTVTAVNSNGCNSSSATTQFTIFSSQGLSTSLSSTTVCKNSTVQLTPNIVGGSAPYTYTWMPGNTNSSSIVTTNSTSTIYTVTIRDNNGCMGISSASVSIANVSANFNYNLNPCNGTFTTINNSTGASSSSWNFGDGTTSSLNQPTHSYAAAGNYTITLISTNSTGCTDTIKKGITISAPVQSIFNAQLNVCDSTVNIVNTSNGAISYAWNFGDGSTSTLQNPNTHTYQSGGNYIISLVVTSGNGCKDSTQKSVTIIKNSVADFNFSISGCSSLVTFTNTSSIAATYNWQFGDGGTSVIPNPVHSYSSSGTFPVTLILNAGTGCSATITKTVTVGNGPQANFIFSISVCNSIVSFTNTTSVNLSSAWNFGDGSSSYINSPAHAFPGNGTYLVSLVVGANSICADTLVQTVVLNNTLVVADFDYTNPETTYDAEFINLSQNATTYHWDFGDGFISNVFEPVHSFPTPGHYPVCLVASNSLGCADTICKSINIDPGWTFYVPNTFSPDGNGINEIFYAYGTNISHFKIRVFDRWGEQLFYSSDIHNGWDGMYKGVDVKPDVYVWKADFNDYKGKSHALTGHIQVLK